MNELKVTVNAKQGEISFNLDSLKENLSAEMETYKNLVVTEDTVKDSKKDLAMLRKVRKELNDKKIEIKKSFMQPYTAFEDEVKEALRIIDEPIALIDTQVKSFEEEKKEEKRELCRKLWEEHTGEYAPYLPFEKVFREDWLKSTFKEKDIVSDIDIAVINVTNNLNAIKSLNSEIEEEVLEVYKRSDLATAIQKNTDYLNTKALAEKRIEEEKKAEEKQEVVSAADITDEIPSAEELPTPIADWVYIRVKASDLERVKNTLDFSEIEYEVKE